MLKRFFSGKDNKRENLVGEESRSHGSLVPVHWPREDDKFVAQAGFFTSYIWIFVYSVS